MKGGGILDFKKGGILEKLGWYDPPYQLRIIFVGCLEMSHLGLNFL